MSQRTGTVIAGKYRILHQIGRGGMSEVYLAEDMRLHRTWAVKVVHRGARDGQIWMARSAMKEAVILSRLDHPGFPRIVDRIETETDVMLIMDYAGETTLDMLVHREGRQSEVQVRIWARQLCDMLNYLHHQDPPVIYRDLKPSNIIYRPFGHLKLIDFGIAAVLTEDSAVHMDPVGTRGYAPPEQYLQGVCDARTDVYALGMTLYFLLTGEPPTEDRHRCRRLREVRPDCSPEMALLIETCTAPDPSDRYPDCDALMRDLLRPEQIGARIRYRRIRNNLLKALVICGTVFVLASAVLHRAVSQFTEEETYRMKVSAEETTDPGQRRKNYMEAIEIAPEKKDAYLKLLEFYETAESFTEEDSVQLLATLNQNRYLLEQDSSVWCELLFRTGKLFFFRYAGQSSSMRERILRAEPFFTECTELRAEDPVYGEKNCFWRLCTFYRCYGTDTPGSGEPDPATLEDMLKATEDLLPELKQYSGADQTAVALGGCREMADLLNSWRFAIYAAGISYERMEQAIGQIHQFAEQIQTLRRDALHEKDLLLKDCELYEEQIAHTWGITP